MAAPSSVENKNKGLLLGCDFYRVPELQRKTYFEKLNRTVVGLFAAVSGVNILYVFVIPERVLFYFSRFNTLK